MDSGLGPAVEAQLVGTAVESDRRRRPPLALSRKLTLT